MARSLKTTILVDRVYRSTAPHNGKSQGVFYLIKTMLPGDLATIVGYNPGAPLRKFNSRTIQVKSLAHYNLELVPYEQEPNELQSEEGKKLAKQRVASATAVPPPRFVRMHIEVVHLDHAALDVMHEIDRLFNSTPDGSRLIPQEMVSPLADALVDLGAELRKAIKTQVPSENRPLGLE